MRSELRQALPRRYQETGMDGPEYGGRKDPYDVLLVRSDGNTTLFQTYR